MKSLSMLIVIAFLLTTSFSGCMPKDIDLQTTINNNLKAQPELSGVTATVKEGIVTLAGHVETQAAKSDAEEVARNVNRVTIVNNNIVVGGNE